MKDCWSRILNNLPLAAAEGVKYTEAAFSDLLESIGDDAREQASLYFVQEIFRKAGVLDSVRLAEGYWRFVSYPARLFACSLLSLMVNGENFFSNDFWASDKNSDSSGQYSVLHALETLRYGTAGRTPIRRTYVAWGIIKRCGGFVLKRRENRGDDPDNTAHGNYVFPGGRLNMADLDDCGASMQEREKLALLYGIPGQLTEEEARVLRSALERTLKRELNEELGLIYETHYEFSVSPVQSPPRAFVHGANGQHCVTESLITFYEIHLTPKGDAFLALKCSEEELFTIDEMIAGQTEKRRVFYDFSDVKFLGYLKTLSDSASRFEAKQSRPSFPGTNSKRTDSAATAILPISLEQPLLFGDMEIRLGNERYVDLLLLLGLNSRCGSELTLLSGAIERKHWGWLRLNSDLYNTACELDKGVKQAYGISPLLMSDLMCRLNVAEENIFFSPSLFSAGLDASELVITRHPITRTDLFMLNSESRSASLSQANAEHLRNLLNGRADLVYYDNLRKLRTRDNRMLDDFARRFGLFRLYEPIDDSVSKERQEFRFSIMIQ